MNFKATVHIMPRSGILDPQGKATQTGLHQLGFSEIQEVFIGKQISLHLTAENEAIANEMVEGACRRLLANLIMETYSFQIEKV